MKKATDRHAKSVPTRGTSLIARARRGDRSAIEALIRRYQQRIAKFVVSQTGDEAHYEDICQTIFVKMVLSLSRLKDTERFEPWLYQIARNACRDHLRRQRGWRRFFVAYDTGHEEVAAPEAPPDEQKLERIALAIEALPDAQRRLLMLSLERGRSLDELAQLSRTSIASVKSRLFRAREGLRAALLKEQSE